MRHALSWPFHIREAVRFHVQKAIYSIRPAGFNQEPAYTAALLARLDGTAYEGRDGLVTFRSTNVDSIGRGAAESWTGADFAITADITQGDFKLVKAILAQAKLGRLDQLSGGDKNRLIGQIRTMKIFTSSPKVLLIHSNGELRDPHISSGKLIAKGAPTQELSLPDYFVRRILTTFDGDTRPFFVRAVEESSLAQLKMFARSE